MVARGTGTIRFGTDGWRAALGHGFTLARLRRVVWAACRVMERQGPPRSRGNDAAELVIGYDRRFLARASAAQAAAVALTAGWRVALASHAATTPACCWQVVHRKAAGALVITASHNPPHDLGIKIKSSHGGPVSSDWAGHAEDLLSAVPPSDVPNPPVESTLADARASGQLQNFRPDGAYLEAVRRYAFGADEAADLTVAADSMYGAAGSCWQPLFAPLGIRTVLVRSTDNPRLPLLPRPEPLPRYLRPLQRAVLRHAAHLGVVTDGDGDRIAAVAEDGRVVDAQQTFALILWYLVEVRGWRGTVVKTYAGTRWIDALARHYGLPFHETPIGFKHVVPYARAEDFLMGGEEAGGIGVRAHLPERDGLLCGLLLVDLVRRTGQPLTHHLARLEELLGPAAYARRDLRLPGAERQAILEQLQASPWTDLAGEACLHVGSLDGIKFDLEHGGWLLVRPSGTEPVVRIYCEGPRPRLVARRLKAAAARVSKIVAGRTE